MVAIEKVCTLLGPLAGECKTMIGEYFEQIWKLVVDEAVRGVCVCVGGGGYGSYMYVRMRSNVRCLKCIYLYLYICVLFMITIHSTSVLYQ